MLFYFFPLYAVKLCKNLKPDAFHSINEYLLDLKYMGYFDGYLEYEECLVLFLRNEQPSRAVVKCECKQL